MRGVSRRVWSGPALFVLVAALGTSGVAQADEPSPFDPPQNRISPPIGAPVAQVRVSPPIGAPVAQNRISPPIGAPASAPEPSLFDAFWRWLEAQAKIGPPVG